MNTPPPVNPPPPGRPGPRRLWLAGADDHRTSDSFDALTDLFLGEVARPGRDQPRPAGEAPTARPSPPAGQPILRLIPAAQGDDLLDLPIPPLAEPPAAALTGPTPVEPPRAGAVGGPGFIECLVVGNLPVLASAWAAQYVREIAAAARRPVAFLRVQAGFVTLELVGELPDDDLAARLPAADFPGALRIAAETAARWVVRVDQADEPAIAARPGTHLVTLITGADEAARVHAYGVLKQLSDKLSDDGEQPAQVRVALMSAAEHVADDVGRKLVETAEQFLKRKVQYAACSARIRASRPARMVFNGRLDQAAGAILDQAERALTLAAATRRLTPISDPRAPSTPHAPSSASSVLPVEPASAPDPSPAPAIQAPAPIEAASSPPAEPPPAPAPIDDVALWSAAAVEVKPSSPAPLAPAATAELAGHIAGLTAISVRCPYAPGVQLGLAPDGRLHLMARAPDAADDERAIAGLMVAASWVQAHTTLLGPALPGYSPAAGPAALHLFTANPKASRRLLDTDLRLHLLAPVTVAGHSGWFCTELN